MLCARHVHDSAAPLWPDCPFWCLAHLVPDHAWHPLRDGMPGRTPTGPSVAVVVRLYEHGELARFPGLGPRRLADIHHCLAAAGLIPALRPVPGQPGHPAASAAVGPGWDAGPPRPA
jgi:hypothetical protein